jgi:hypothetical protein
MAKVVSTPTSVFINNKAQVGKFCLTDEDAASAQEQYRRDTLQAILVVSIKEKEAKANTSPAARFRFENWHPQRKSEKSWFRKLKDKAGKLHESALVWYEDWKEGNYAFPEKTFEEKVEEMRINIVETRRLQKEDPGYEC